MNVQPTVALKSGASARADLHFPEETVAVRQASLQTADQVEPQIGIGVVQQSAPKCEVGLRVRNNGCQCEGERRCND